MTLRSDIKKLAASKPELRAALLPLLRQGASFQYRGQQGHPLDMAYAMSDMLAEIKRGLPPQTALRETRAVQKALFDLERAVSDAGTHQKYASRPKQAGGFSIPLLNKMITPRIIQNAVKKEGGFDMGFFDFSKVEFDTVDPMHPMYAGRGKGVEAIWRVFPPGEFGNRESDYIWGTVRARIESSGKGIQVEASVYVKV